jgi:hypothetical protein
MLTVPLTFNAKPKQLAPRGSFRCQKLAKNSFWRSMYLEKAVQRLIGSAQLLPRSNKDHYTNIPKKSMYVQQIDIQRLYRNDLNGTGTAVSPHAKASRSNPKASYFRIQVSGFSLVLLTLNYLVYLTHSWKVCRSNSKADFIHRIIKVFLSSTKLVPR